MSKIIKEQDSSGHALSISNKTYKDSLYMHALLLQFLPGFEWFSWRGFLVGLIESFLYGAYAGLVYVPIYNFLHRKFATQ